MDALAPQIEKPVAEAGFLAIILVRIDLQRQGFRRAQHLDLANDQFDLAGRQVGINRLVATLDHIAGHADHGFQPNRFQNGENRAGNIDNALGEPKMIPKIDKQQISVIALAVDPAGNPGGRTGIVDFQRVAVMGSVSMHFGASRGLLGLAQDCLMSPAKAMERPVLSRLLP